MRFTAAMIATTGKNWGLSSTKTHKCNMFAPTNGNHDTKDQVTSEKPHFYGPIMCILIRTDYISLANYVALHYAY
jgi:hypothetical protein